MLGVVLAMPAGVRAATVAREGDELVVRGDAGAPWAVRAAPAGPSARFSDMTTTGGPANQMHAGPGCSEVRDPDPDAICDTAGASAVHAIGGDGNDEFSLFGWSDSVAVTVDFGAGNDRFTELRLPHGAGRAPLTVHAGDGDDEVDIPGGEHAPITVEGGAGDDRLSAQGPGARVDGGPGDDEIGTSDDHLAEDVTCGPGADRVSADPADHLGAGCGSHFAGVHEGRVLGSFSPATGAIRLDRGRLTGTVSATVRIYAQVGVRPPLVARATRHLRRGPVALTLHATATGARLLRHGKRVRIYLQFRGRSSSAGEAEDVIVTTTGYLAPR